MDQEASSSSFGSSTSTSTSNPEAEAEGRSTPPDEAPKPELAEQHQSTESGIGDDASFSVAHSASDDHNGSMFHAFSVDNSYKALKPINVEGANNGVLFENRSLSSSSEGDDSLVNLDGIDLPSPNTMSNSTLIVRVEQVQQAAFYSDTGPSFQASVSEQIAGPSENNTACGVTSQTRVPQCVGTSLQTVAESAFGEGPSFQVSVSEQVAKPDENDTAHAYGDTSGSQIHVPQRVGTSSEESAFGEGPSFQVSKQVVPQAGEDDTGYGGTSGSQIHVPQCVGTSFKASRVERNSGFSADGSNVLVKSSPRIRDRYPIPVEDQTELYSEECQEYEKMIKKAVAVSESHESAGHVRYLTKMIRELDRKNCMKDKLLKKSKKRITEYQLQTHLKEKEIDMLRQQVADTEQENDRHQSKIEHLEREVDCIKFQKEAEEKNKFRFEFIPRGDSPRDVRAKFEKKLETVHQKYQKIVDEKDAEISRLQARNAVTEADALRLEKEKTFAMKNDEINVLLQTVFQVIERHPEKESLHLQMTEKSKSYAHFHSTKKRAGLEALSSASVQERIKPGSISAPVRADLLPFDDLVPSEVEYRSLSSPFEHLNIASGVGLTESLGNSKLDTVIKDEDLIHLAAYFDCATVLAASIPLYPHEDGDVKRAKASEGTQVAVHLCLKYWKRRKPKEATFQALLTIVRKLRKEDTVIDIETYCNLQQ